MAFVHSLRQLRGPVEQQQESDVAVLCRVVCS